MLFTLFAALSGAAGTALATGENGKNGGSDGSGESVSTTAARLEWSPGTVLFLRHAPAPGFGDPADFRLDDCATQRNLDESGRAAARAIGAVLRRSAPPIAAVYSSRWCRCLETAALLGLGAARPFSGLNSFFQGLAPRAPTLAALGDFMSGLDRSGPPILLVTHQVVIGAASGILPPSGGLVAYDLKTGKSRTVPLALESAGE